MTPDEKAKELVEKFSKSLSSYSMSKKHRYEYAIQCAIICVEEILNLPGALAYEDENAPENSKQFWQQVLNHLK